MHDGIELLTQSIDIAKKVRERRWRLPHLFFGDDQPESERTFILQGRPATAVHIPGEGASRPKGERLRLRPERFDALPVLLLPPLKVKGGVLQNGD